MSTAKRWSTCNDTTTTWSCYNNKKQACSRRILEFPENPLRVASEKQYNTYNSLNIALSEFYFRQIITPEPDERETPNLKHTHRDRSTLSWSSRVTPTSSNADNNSSELNFSKKKKKKTGEWFYAWHVLCHHCLITVWCCQVEFCSSSPFCQPLDNWKHFIENHVHIIP